MAGNYDSDNEEDEEEECCPTCIEPLNEKGETKLFFPCPCNYRICMFCVRRIMTEFDGRCPGCRRDYSEEKFRFEDKPVTQTTTSKRNQTGKRKNKHGDTSAGNGHGKYQNNNHHQQQQMQQQLPQHIQSQPPQPQPPIQLPPAGTQGTPLPNHILADGLLRKDLSNVRVVQRNLVYLVGLAPSIAKEETLRSKEFFGQYGKIVKVAINRNDRDRDTTGDASRPASFSAYITFAREEDARAAIKAVNGFWIDNYVIKASFGTTKYCNMFLRGLQCTNPDCLYLHKLGDDASSFTKEEMQTGRAGFHDMTQLRADLQRTDSSSQASSEGTSHSISTHSMEATHPPTAAAVVAGHMSATTASNPSSNPWGSGGADAKITGGWAAAAAGIKQSASTSGDASAKTGMEPLVPPKGFQPSKAGSLSRQHSASSTTQASGSKLSKPPSPPPGMGTQQQQASEPASILAELGGVSLEEYLETHPAQPEPSDRAPGPKNAPRLPLPEQPLPSKDRMQEELDKAIAQVLLQQQMQQRLIQQQKILQQQQAAHVQAQAQVQF